MTTASRQLAITAFTDEADDGGDDQERQVQRYEVGQCDGSGEFGRGFQVDGQTRQRYGE